MGSPPTQKNTATESLDAEMRARWRSRSGPHDKGPWPGQAWSLRGPGSPSGPGAPSSSWAFSLGGPSASPSPGSASAASAALGSGAFPSASPPGAARQRAQTSGWRTRHGRRVKAVLSPGWPSLPRLVLGTLPKATVCHPPHPQGTAKPQHPEHLCQAFRPSPAPREKVSRQPYPA